MSYAAAVTALPTITVGFPPGPHTVELAPPRRGRRLRPRVALRLRRALRGHLDLARAHGAGDVGEARDHGPRAQPPSCHDDRRGRSRRSRVSHPGAPRTASGPGRPRGGCSGRRGCPGRRTRRYIETLRALLHGDVVEIDGARTQMLHHPDLAPAARPIDVPILLSAIGPKGREIAHEIADGIITVGTGDEGFDVCVGMMNGSVLDPGEDVASPRVREALGPWYVLSYHGTWQWAGDAVDGLPLGAEWRAGIEAERPEGERHLAVHEGHATHVLERDRLVLDAAGDALKGAWVGTPDELRARAEAAAASGITELLYTPSGPDMAARAPRVRRRVHLRRSTRPLSRRCRRGCDLPSTPRSSRRSSRSSCARRAAHGLRGSCAPGARPRRSSPRAAAS